MPNCIKIALITHNFPLVFYDKISMCKNLLGVCIFFLRGVHKKRPLAHCIKIGKQTHYERDEVIH